MNGINRLIAERCRDGVIHGELSKFAELVRGTSITKKQITEGTVPVVAGGRTVAYTHGESNRDGETIVIAGSGAYAGFASWWEGPIFVSDAFSIKPIEEFLLPKFCFHWLLSKQDELHRLKRGGGVPHVYAKDVGKLRVPLPPLEMQREIVRVLDQFTALEAELEAELEARQRQYDHYRREAFTFGPDVGFSSLGDLAKNLDSRRKPVTRGARVPGAIPYYGASGIVDCVSEYIFDGDYLLVSEDGANLLTRSTPIAFSISGKTWVNNHAHVLEFPTYTERRFVEIYLNSIDLAPYISGAAQPKLNKTNLNKIPVPSPPMAIKDQIVEVFDKFDTLVNDLSIGLPAELAARRKQYEYYRDQLLTFEEAV